MFGLQYFEVLYLAEIGLFHPGREYPFHGIGHALQAGVATTVKAAEG